MTSKVKGQGRKVTWRVWQVLADKPRTKRHRNTKIGRKVVHPTGNKHTSFKVKGQGHQADIMLRLEVRHDYLPNGKAYELQTWYTDEGRIPASATSAVTYKFKGQGRKVTWCICQLLADKSRTKRPRNTKMSAHSRSFSIFFFIHSHSVITYDFLIHSGISHFQWKTCARSLKSVGCQF